MIPVISSNALVSTVEFIVVRRSGPSDSTLTSMPANGLAASMNHCISFSCSSRDSVEGWNSLSTHFSAAAMSAHDALGAMQGERRDRP